MNIKMIMVLAICVGLIITGCSGKNVKLTAEQLTIAAENLARTVIEARDTLKPIVRNDSLSQPDQEMLVEQIKTVIVGFENFKSANAPLMGEKFKKIAVKELDQRENELISVSKKAQVGSATVKDVEKVMNLLSSDLKINDLKGK